MLVMILGWMLIGVLVVLLAFPQTPVARLLHCILVDAPARALQDVSWAKLGKALMLGAVFAVLATAGPELMMMFAALGADAVALDILFAVWLASASGAVAPAWRRAAAALAGAWGLIRRLAAPRARTRSPRRSKPRRPRKANDKGEPGPAWVFA